MALDIFIPSNDKLLKKAYDKYRRLFDEGRFSLSRPMGALAIHVATATDRSKTPPELQKQYFREEGEKIKAYYDGLGRDDEDSYAEVRLYLETDKWLLDHSLQDPDVASIITVGHGNIGNFHLPMSRNYDWSNVSRATNHLKQGEIVQRTCGHIRQGIKTVPWGVFALADQRNLRATIGQSIEEQLSPGTEADQHFPRLYESPSNSLEEILERVDRERAASDPLRISSTTE